MPNGVPYDTEAGILASAIQIKSTVIPLVIDGPEFWILCILNITICVLRHSGFFDPTYYHINLPWGLTSATGSLMTFFVCFYNKHVFERYNTVYDLTKFMEECILQMVSNLRVSTSDREVQRKVAKLLLVSCFMFYYERTGGTEEDAKEGCKISKHEYAQLHKIDLLDPLEIKSLERFCKRYREDSMPSLLLMQWCMQLMRRATPEPTTRDDLLIGFDDKMYELRDAMSDVTNIMDLPMPFQYFHIMNMMLVLNLVLWAYALGCQDSFWAPIIYMFVQMMFQGIRELSTALSDPFGDDEVDFDINSWMKSLYTRILGLLEDQYDLDECSIDGNKPLKDPDSTSRKINLVIDRETSESAVETKEKRRRVKKCRSQVHPWANFGQTPHQII
jgi:predicted membrane chloride channel (bestrophin family)